jgi:hypothetical protein
MKVFTLGTLEIDELQEAIDEAVKNRTLLRIGFCEVDNAVKVKTYNRWSPPLGTLEIDD